MMMTTNVIWMVQRSQVTVMMIRNRHRRRICMWRMGRVVVAMMMRKVASGTMKKAASGRTRTRRAASGRMETKKEANGRMRMRKKGTKMMRKATPNLTMSTTKTTTTKTRMRTNTTLTTTPMRTTPLLLEERHRRHFWPKTMLSSSKVPPISKTSARRSGNTTKNGHARGRRTADSCGWSPCVASSSWWEAALRRRSSWDCSAATMAT